MSDEVSGGEVVAGEGASGAARDITLERTVVISGAVASGAAVTAPRPAEPQIAWQRGQDAMSSLEREIGELAAAMHRHARTLEPFVEGTYASDTADPRTQLLIHALDIARTADRRLGRLDNDLRRLRESARSLAATGVRSAPSASGWLCSTPSPRSSILRSTSMRCWAA